MKKLQSEVSFLRVIKGLSDTDWSQSMISFSWDYYNTRNRRNDKKNYLPDKQEKATRNVLEQAELFCVDWAA